MTFQPARAGHQNQHLIPQADRIQNNPVIKALKEGTDGNGNPLFDIDDNVRNRLELPTKKTTADALQRALYPSATHTGSHAAYTDFVDNILNKIGRQFNLIDEFGNLTNIQLNASQLANLDLEVKKFQFALAWNLTGTPGNTGFAEKPNFILNNADPRLNPKATQAEIYDQVYKKFTHGDNDIRNSVEYKRALDFLDTEIDGRKFDFNYVPDGVDGRSGLQINAYKAKAAKQIGISKIGDFDLSKKTISQIDDALRSTSKMDELKNLIEALKNNTGGSADIGGKFAGLSNKLGALDLAMVGLIGVGLYQIANESNVTLEQLLEELDIDISPELIASAAAGVTQLAFEYAVLSVLSGGVGTVAKLAYEANESKELIELTAQVLSIAFPEWNLGTVVDDAAEGVEKAFQRVDKYVKDTLLQLALTISGADGLTVADGTAPTEFGKLRAEGDENINLMLGLGLAEIAGNEGNDWLVHTGVGKVEGNTGDDVLIAWIPDYIKAGEQIGEAPPEGEEDTRPTAPKDLELTLDGGEGDDWIVTVLGEKAITIGGLGRDWIFNTSQDGEIYGDTIDGRDPDGGALTPGDQANSDLFWWWPGTTIKDAGPEDHLQFFGIPLTGGTNNIPMLAFAASDLKCFDVMMRSAANDNTTMSNTRAA